MDPMLSSIEISESLAELVLSSDNLSSWDAIRKVVHESVGASGSEVYVHDKQSKVGFRLLEKAANERLAFRKGEFRFTENISNRSLSLIRKAVEFPSEKFFEDALVPGLEAPRVALPLVVQVTSPRKPRLVGVVVLAFPEAEMPAARARVMQLRQTPFFGLLQLCALYSEMARRINSSSTPRSLDGALDSILETVCDILGFSSATISLVDEYRGRSPQGELLPLQIRTIRGKNVPKSRTKNVQSSVQSSDVSARVWRTGHSEVLPKVDSPIVRGNKEAITSDLLEIHIPLGGVGTISGYLNADLDGGITSAMLQLLQRWGSEASIAVQKARLYDRIKRRAEAIERLREFNKEMDNLLPTRERVSMLEKIAEGAKNVLLADLVLFYWVEKDETKRDSSIDLIGPIAIGELRGSTMLAVPKGAYNIVNHIASTKKAYLQPDAQDDEVLGRHTEASEMEAESFHGSVQFPKPRSFVERQGIRSFCGIPLLRGQELLGVLCLNFREYRLLGDYELELMELFAEEAVEALSSNETSVELVLAKERRRIARDMHDGVKTSIRTIVMDANRAMRFAGESATGIREELIDIMRIGWSTMTEIDLILDNLEAGVVDDLPLDQIVEHELSSSFGQSQLTVSRYLQDNLPVVHRKVSDAVRLVLREALVNAMNHSRASYISVRTTYIDDLFKLEVCDNGIGFDAHSELAGSHRGLAIMHDRVDELPNATIHIESDQGSGTKVTTTIPCRGTIKENFHNEVSSK